MAEDDFKRRLQQLAQDAPDTASLRDRLVPKIRRRRRIRQTVLTASAICGVGAVTAGVLTGVSMRSPEPIRPADPAQAAADKAWFKTFGACGSRVASPSATALPLQLTAAPPTTPLRVADGPFVQIDMSVTNVSPSALRVITSQGALMAITSNGVVVASPERAVRAKGYVYNLEPAAMANYKSTIHLRSCDGTSGTLPPGHYQLHALQRFTALVDEPLRRGPEILVPGGPWEIEIG